MGLVSWNPWHGCHKISEGCRNCYVYRGDMKHGRDSRMVSQTKNFDLPIKKKRNGELKVPPNSLVATCFTSDFFLEHADEWRKEAWSMIRQRRDLNFFMITKRIDRFHVNLPCDWGSGYENVSIGCTVENQDRADFRLPIFKEVPIKRKMIICEPLLEPLQLDPYLDSSILQVVVGGESGAEARVCDYAWVLAIRDQCLASSISFWFKQTGARFAKDRRLYKIKRQQQHSQARKANISSNVKMY